MGNDTEILGQTDGHAFILVIFINDFINLLFKLMECQINSVFSCYKAGHKVWFQTSESESQRMVDHVCIHNIYNVSC